MRNSAMARLGVMVILTLALLVPLTMVQSTVSERAMRREAAVREVSATWGSPQTFGGPVLSIPYTQVWTDTAGRSQRSVQAVQFLPKQVQIAGVVVPERRWRGIFGVIVYRAMLKVSGRFVRPSMDSLKVAPELIDWDQATLNVGISDPRGLTTRASLEWNTRTLPFTGGIADIGLFASGIHASVPGLGGVAEGTGLPFSFTVEMNGTRDIRVLPASGETAVKLSSAWPHPSFSGAPLPQSHAIGEGGFTAQWAVMDFGRPYPEQWTTVGMDRQQLMSHADGSAFGVSLLQPVDIYQQAERAVKYAVLFIMLTFLVFFLWEVFAAALLHPMHYAFVGCALCLFYLLLVSMSEHAGFDAAYAVSSTGATLLIGGYSRAILKGTRQAVSVIGSLAVLYSFLYLLLRLEDYALMAGTIGVFLVLAFVMFVTRRMDWYSLRLGGNDTGGVSVPRA